MSKSHWINWSKTVVSSPETILSPSTEDEIVNIVKSAITNNFKVKVVGSGHSCSDILKSDSGILISLENYNNVINYNDKLKQLTVQSGASLKSIGEYLSSKSAALSNLGTIHSQSISGAISTGTHGTGLGYGAIDQQVIELKIINGLGEIHLLNNENNPELFNLCKVGLGAYGVILSVKIQCVNSFSLKIDQKSIKYEEFKKYFNTLDNYDHLRFWWAPHTDKIQLWSAERVEGIHTKGQSDLGFFNTIIIGRWCFELLMWMASFFKQLGFLTNAIIFKLTLGRSLNYTQHSKDAFVVPISIKQTVMEYAIPIEFTFQAIKELRKIIEERKYYVHMPIEFRFTPKNDALLSMSYGRASCYVGVISYKPFGKSIFYDDFFSEVHKVLSSHSGRPHWAKKHYYEPKDLNLLYPKWVFAKKIRSQWDPKSIFINKFLEQIFN